MRAIGEQNADEEVEEKVAVDLQADVRRDRMLLLTGAEENTRRVEVMSKALEQAFDRLEIIGRAARLSIRSKPQARASVDE